MRPRFVMGNETIEIYDVPGQPDCCMLVVDPEKGPVAPAYLFQRNDSDPTEPYCVDIQDVLTARLAGLELYEPRIRSNRDITKTSDAQWLITAYCVGCVGSRRIEENRR